MRESCASAAPRRHRCPPLRIPVTRRARCVLAAPPKAVRTATDRATMRESCVPAAPRRRVSVARRALAGAR
eukprot:14297164-Alexandrium_andersonii.AAC.1